MLGRRPAALGWAATRVYFTAETEADSAIATRIRELAAGMRGVTRIGDIGPDSRGQADDALVLRRRVAAARALAAHQVAETMRSSRAALIQHVAGTAAALAFEGMSEQAGAESGDMLSRTAALPLPKIDLACDLPDWLSNEAAWGIAVADDHQRYERILELAKQLSDARESGKARHVLELHLHADRVLVFDSHPITLSKVGQVLERLLGVDGNRVVYGTGANARGKKQVAKALSRDSTQRVIGLCSNSISEAVNLQGASVLVHLDLPTTLRVAEQRVGRIDRMDSPHRTIQTWWPQDSPAFATRAAEVLAARAADSTALLGSNLDLPSWDNAPDLLQSEPVETTLHIATLSAEAERGDGIEHALKPVHDLVYGAEPLLPTDLYEQLTGVTARVLARVSHVQSDTPWGFFAVASAGHGAPRWLLLEGRAGTPVFDQHAIVTRLRQLLGNDPAPHSPNDASQELLAGYLDRINHAEPRMLPRLHQAALDQMRAVLSAWRTADMRRSLATAPRWAALAEIADPAESAYDLFTVAQRWLQLVRPTMSEYARTSRNPLPRLRDVTPRLVASPVPLVDLELRFKGLAPTTPAENRITAGILGVPSRHLGG